MAATNRRRSRDTDPLRHLPLHPLEFRILLALLNGPGHGYRIVKAIEGAGSGGADGFGSGRIYPANLYRRVRDLTAKGLLAEAEPPPDDPAPDPRRTYLALTELGRSVARAEARRLEALLAEARAAGLVSP